MLNGPRQSGKTTLARQLADGGYRYLTLDDAATLLSAQADPVGLVRSLDRAVIDEVQRAPGLLLAIKQAIDEDRRPGRFLLTGSAHSMTLPGVADSLAGRMEVLALLPLAAAEIQRRPGHFLAALLASDPPGLPAGEVRPLTGRALVQKVLSGGYPEAVSRPDPRRRAAWARHYVEALIQRDVRDIASVEKLDHLPRLLRALAHMAGQLPNYSTLAGQVGIDAKTASKYLGIFEQMFLLTRVAPWFANRLARVVKTPKLHFIDSGLLASLAALGETRLVGERTRFGPLLETWVYSELLKQANCTDDGVQIFHYRDKDQVEVDFVLESAAGGIAGVEVKAAATVQAADFGGLRKLTTLAGKRWLGGIVLYDGTETLPMGQRLWAVPLAGLMLA
jgi:predicted AAA+ superfamily ATPase